MADGGEPMIGFLRGDELQNLFGKVPKGQKTEKHDAEQRRKLLARKAKKRSIPPKPKYRVLERLETQLKREGVIQERAERRGRSLYAQLELEQRRIKQQQKADARAPLERHKAARMRELGPDHHLLELREISTALNLDLERCRELEDATKATVAFSTQHDALCRDVAKRAARKGVKDHDLYDVDDIERDEAATIINESTEALVFDHRCALEDDGLDPDEIDRRCVEFRAQLDDESLADEDDARRVRGKKEAWKRDNVRRVEALWRRKAWARALPRHKLADAPYLAKAAARRPSVGDGAQDLTAPAHRREQRWKKTQKLMSRTAPSNPAERAQQLRQELEKCDRFMRATDAVVRRTQERTLAISTRLVAADHATAFAVPIAEPLPKDAVRRREGAVDEEVAPELRRRCAEWGARRLARVFRAGAFRLQLKGLTVWSCHAQYQRNLIEANLFTRLAAGRRLCRVTSAAKVRMKKFDAVEIWRNVALGCRDVVRSVAAVEIERYARSYRARRLTEWRRRRRAATLIQTRQRQIPARIELARRVEEKRRRLAATLIQKVRRDVVACRKARKILNRRRRYVRARTIQRRVRSNQARRRVARARRRRRRNLAALAIQCLQRGGRIRVRADRLRRRRRRRKAAIVLQTRGRGYLVRLRIKGTKAEHAAAERVQHVIRRFLKACKAWHEANARATRVLENCMRIVIARRRMAKRAEERRVEARLRALCGKGKDPQTTSASFLQLWYRRLVTRWQREGSAFTIQCQARAYIARRAMSNLLKRRKAGAALINRWFRGEIARLNCAAQMWQLELQKAARKIQKPWRGALARRRWRALCQDKEALQEAAERVKEDEAWYADPANQQYTQEGSQSYYDESTGEWVTYDQGDQTSWEQYPPPIVFENYWEARDHYMKQQEELVGEAVRALQRFGVFRTWRLNRYNAICVIQKLYRTQIENIRLRAMQEAVRLEQLRAAAADKFAALWKGRQSRNFVANKLREKRRALAFRKKRLLAALLIQARARGMICREGIRRRLMEEAWKRQQGMAQVREDASLVIECAQRCRMARWWMRKRRAERIAEEEEREKDRLLELALDRLKKEQEINLLAMRVQCLWRRRKASRSLEDQMRRLVEEEREAAARAKFLNAACIQALARGVRKRAWFARNHASLVDSKTIRGALLRMRARQAAEVEKVTARMRHLDKFGPSEYLWSGVRDELEGVTRENEAPSEAGPANEPWQEQHWSERLPQSPEKGAPGEWEEQWDDSAQATYWYNRKTGEASWVDPTQQHLLGTPER